MKCKECNHTFLSPIDSCPFCSAPHIMLKCIYKHWGESIIGSDQFLGVMWDLMPNAEEQYKRIFRQVLIEKIDVSLLKFSKLGVLGKLKIQLLCDTFKKNNSYTEYADYVLNSFLFAYDFYSSEDIEKLRENVTNTIIYRKRKRVIITLFLSIFIICFIIIIFSKETPQLNELQTKESLRAYSEEESTLQLIEIYGSYTGRILTESESIPTYLNIKKSNSTDSLIFQFKSTRNTFSCLATFDQKECKLSIVDLGNCIAFKDGSFIKIKSNDKFRKYPQWEFNKNIVP